MRASNEKEVMESHAPMEGAMGWRQWAGGIIAASFTLGALSCSSAGLDEDAIVGRWAGTVTQVVIMDSGLWHSRERTFDLTLVQSAGEVSGTGALRIVDTYEDGAPFEDQEFNVVATVEGVFAVPHVALLFTESLDATFEGQMVNGRIRGTLDGAGFDGDSLVLRRQ